MSRKAIVVGVSGASSSGKTTLSRLLRDIFPNSFIIHEDDFYRPEAELPSKDGLLDWDSPDSLSVPRMVTSLQHIHENGTFPPDLDSKEDRNSVGASPVADAVVDALKAKVSAWTQPGQPGHGVLTSSSSPLRLCLLDGFLLYCPEMVAIQAQMDVKLFLRVSYATAKARREARSGYVTIEGFWEDPPGYVDKIVWPNYVENHKWMFEDGDVEGQLSPATLQEWNIQSPDGSADIDFGVILEWAVDTLMEQLPRFVVT